jgi:hypothetical protein
MRSNAKIPKQHRIGSASGFIRERCGIAKQFAAIPVASPTRHTDDKEVRLGILLP